jgi:ABC-type thiamin/hydroxymethylpyrimidine transport system permease subunit
MKFSTRELVLMAVFGALWGLVEITLGSVFHAIDLPLSGMTLGVIGVMLASIGRLFVPRRGSTLFIGAIAMVLKLFSIGSSVLGPMVGIMSEAIVAEIVLDLFPRPSLAAFMLANMAAALITLIQPFITGLVFFGRSMFIVWLDLLDSGARIFKLPAEAAIVIVAILVIVHLAAGAVGGWVGWGLGRTLQARLSGTTRAAAA